MISQMLSKLSKKVEKVVPQTERFADNIEQL